MFKWLHLMYHKMLSTWLLCLSCSTNAELAQNLTRHESFGNAYYKWETVSPYNKLTKNVGLQEWGDVSSGCLLLIQLLILRKLALTESQRLLVQILKIREDPVKISWRSQVRQTLYCTTPNHSQLCGRVLGKSKTVAHPKILPSEPCKLFFILLRRWWKGVYIYIYIRFKLFWWNCQSHLNISKDLSNVPARSCSISWTRSWKDRNSVAAIIELYAPQARNGTETWQNSTAFTAFLLCSCLTERLTRNVICQRMDLTKSQSQSLPWDIHQCLAEKSAASPQHHRVKSWDCRNLTASPELNLSIKVRDWGVKSKHMPCRCGSAFPESVKNLPCDPCDQSLQALNVQLFMKAWQHVETLGFLGATGWPVQLAIQVILLLSHEIELVQTDICLVALQGCRMHIESLCYSEHVAL